MLLRFLAKKTSVPLAAVALILGGLYAVQALADYTPGAYLDAQTFMVTWRMVRVGASTISCTGVCRTAQAGGANPATCRLTEAPQTSTANCITALAADCTPQAALNCTSGERL
jgi:hypothetical protein